jgi:hypothetical protein
MFEYFRDFRARILCPYNDQHEDDPLKRELDLSKPSGELFKGEKSWHQRCSVNCPSKNPRGLRCEKNNCAAFQRFKQILDEAKSTLSVHGPSFDSTEKIEKLLDLGPSAGIPLLLMGLLRNPRLQFDWQIHNLNTAVWSSADWISGDVKQGAPAVRRGSSHILAGEAIDEEATANFLNPSARFKVSDSACLEARKIASTCLQAHRYMEDREAVFVLCMLDYFAGKY